MTDPTINNTAGTATLNFDSTTNYTLSKTRITNVFGSNSLLLSPQNSNVNEDFEDSPLDLLNVWNTNNLTERSTTNSAIDTYNYIIESSPTDGDKLSTRAIFPSATPNGKRLITLWFYDDGSSGGGTEYYFTAQPVAASTTQKGILALGWDTDGASPNRYVYSIGSGTNVDSGVNRSSGWHKLTLWTYFNATVDNKFYKLKIFLDGSQIYSDEQTLDPTDPAPYTTTYRAFAWTCVDAGAPTYNIDELLMYYSENDIYESGTAQIDIQPADVTSFDSVTVSDNTSGAWSGTISYQFQYSSNGGSSFGSLQTLNNTNLQALSPVGGGQDVIRVLITHTPYSTEPTYIPKTNQIIINFTPNVVTFIPRLTLLGAG